MKIPKIFQALLATLCCSCALRYPQSIPENVRGPLKVSCGDTEILVYIEANEDSYSVVGIHPAFGRDFLLRIEGGESLSGEYGRFCSRTRVHEIINELGDN